MQTINDAIKLLRRQADLEAAMRKPGGIRIIEEQELIMLRRRLAEYPQAVMQAPMPRANRSPQSRQARLRLGRIRRLNSTVT